MRYAKVRVVACDRLCPFYQIYIHNMGLRKFICEPENAGFRERIIEFPDRGAIGDAGPEWFPEWCPLKEESE